MEINISEHHQTQSVLFQAQPENIGFQVFLFLTNLKKKIKFGKNRSGDSDEQHFFLVWPKATIIILIKLWLIPWKTPYLF